MRLDVWVNRQGCISWRGTCGSLEDRFRSDVEVTPTGPYHAGPVIEWWRKRLDIGTYAEEHLTINQGGQGTLESLPGSCKS